MSHSPSDASTHSATDPPFYTRYGFTRTGNAETPLVIAPYPEICVGGALRATVVASAIDLVGGFFTREVAGTDATFTSDLSLRIPEPGCPVCLLARGETLRKGRRLVSTGVTLEAVDTASAGAAEGGAASPLRDGRTNVYAYGQTTFARIPRKAENAPDLETLSTPLEIERHPLARPLDLEVGVEILDAGRGHVILPFRPALLNPEGVLQGALVALLVESAALAMARDNLGREQVVSELDLRYLASAANGPVESTTRWIGDPSARMIAVELRDRGRGDRLTTTALVRVVDAG